MAGGGDVTPLRPLASRSAGHPHWWGVLAVALALMALVAAISSTDPGPATTGLSQRYTTRYSGRLDYPTSDSAVYRQGVRGGTERAVVRSLGTPPIRLKLACPGGNRTVVGTASLEVGVPAGDGVCQVTVSAASPSTASPSAASPSASRFTLTVVERPR